ncbi:hypothetical protein ACFYWS_39380 [Streptomyces sp. NPDC002795]|uniref:hypothetical protein n=1 Tax=Streptomyces sp. NPDC002795 TaxID=3364665 RepID=UPI0036BB9056
MPNYLAQYRQAIRDGAHDYARTVLVSAMQAARNGLVTEEQVAELAQEVRNNPPSS